MSHAIDALPSRLPQGERVLWQGRPAWWSLARRGFHFRELALYLGVLLAWYGVTEFGKAPLDEAALATLRMTGVALTPLALVCLYTWLNSRSTVYTITNRRVVLRTGIAMPITFNLPFNKIDGAASKVWPSGHGDIALTLSPTERLSYVVLWPHAKPWRTARTQPMLRSVPEAATVAQILGRALAASAEMAVPVSQQQVATEAPRAHTAALA
jgi:hypothetical protein